MRFTYKQNDTTLQITNTNVAIPIVSAISTNFDDNPSICKIPTLVSGTNYCASCQLQTLYRYMLYSAKLLRLLFERTTTVAYCTEQPLVRLTCRTLHLPFRACLCFTMHPPPSTNYLWYIQFSWSIQNSLQTLKRKQLVQKRQ